MNFNVRSALFASAGFAALIGAAAPAVAQEAAAAPAGAVEEVVVTGSRIINGNAMPTPVTVVSAEALTAIVPGPISQAVGQLPVFAGTRSTDGANGTNGTALGLRFLGFSRTLILYDGKRLAPTSYDQVIDSSTIPQMLLNRVDVVTGGVSAVYGSDAVAGVVNFITDRNFNGIKAEVSTGISQKGDGQRSEFGIAGGMPLFDGRGHVEGSYQINNDVGISRRSKRFFGYQNISGQFGLGTAAVPFHTIDNARISTATFGGLITGATAPGTRLNNQIFGVDSNTILPFVNGIESGSPGVQSGGSGAFHDTALRAKSRNQQLFGRFDYDVTDSLHFFVDGAYSTAHIDSHGDYARFNTLQFSGTNPYLPASQQFAGTFRLSKLDTQLERAHPTAEKKSWFVLAGFEGSLGDYKWDVAVNQSRAENEITANSQINLEKFYAAIDTVRDASGAIVCRAAQLNPSVYSGCVPYNLFGYASASQAAMNYITQPTKYTNVNTMTDLTANIAGSPFSLWAGPVQFAITGEYRKQSLEVFGNAHPADLMNCTGLTFNCVATLPKWFETTQADLPKLSTSVAEIGIETEVPLLNDLPLIKSLSFNGAFRYTDYKTSGSVETYKLGLTWDVNDQLKVRLARSRDIRAPNLYELYYPASVTVQAASDRLFGLSGVITPRYAGGNPNLTPEKAKTTTIGVVYTPDWSPGTSLSMDAFQIDIRDAMYEGSGASTAGQLLCYNSKGTSPLCSLITRALGSYTSLDPRNVQTAFYIKTLNVGQAKTYGIDFEANHRMELFGNPLTLRSLVTWQPHFVTVVPGPVRVEGAGVTFSDYSFGRTALPKVRATLFAGYKVGNLNFQMRERWRSRLCQCNVPGSVYVDGYIPQSHYTDLTVTYALPNQIWGTDTEVSLNIQNLLNTRNKNVGLNTATGIGNSAGFVGGDDPVGRYFTLSFKVRR